MLTTALRAPGGVKVPCRLFLGRLRLAGRAAASAQEMAPKKCRPLSLTRAAIGEQTVVARRLLPNALGLDPGARPDRHLTHRILLEPNKAGLSEVNSSLLNRPLVLRYSKNVAFFLAVVEPTQLHPPRTLKKWTIGVQSVPSPKLVRPVEAVSAAGNFVRAGYSIFPCPATTSNPPTPQLGGRRKLELLPRGAPSTAAESPLSSPRSANATSAKSSPFGAAKYAHGNP